MLQRNILWLLHMLLISLIETTPDSNPSYLNSKHGETFDTDPLHEGSSHSQLSFDMGNPSNVISHDDHINDHHSYSIVSFVLYSLSKRSSIFSNHWKSIYWCTIRSQVTSSFCLFVNFVSLIDPKRTTKALCDLDWIMVVQDEIHELKRHKVVTLILRAWTCIIDFVYIAWYWIFFCYYFHKLHAFMVYVYTLVLISLTSPFWLWSTKLDFSNFPYMCALSSKFYFRIEVLRSKILNKCHLFFYIFLS